MTTNDGSEFIGGYMHNQAQPLDVFDAILQEVERTGVKASQTTLIISLQSWFNIGNKRTDTLKSRFAEVLTIEQWVGIGFMFRPAR